MRYSMLVYITKMGRTLIEAARYLHDALPQDGMRAEILENGGQMLAQMQDILQQSREGLHSDAPLVRLRRIGALWESGSGDTEEMLRQWIETLPQEISYQMRAVFFAELGEKWDAMESVYEYMKDDPRFDPVIVRTPVGRVVHRDGKQEQEIIYRDFLTPMGISSFGYDEYDIEKDCPELAFISQPYESCTPEQFWPENIAKHTRLVYLPYYLPDILHEGSTQALCQLPVYKYAWKAVCASEKQLAFYCKHSVHQGANALLAGSPKLDRIFALKEQGIALPDGWKTIRGKTVILWNSWYDINQSSLRYADALMSWFEEHREYCLLWRPHPMTDTVTKLYYPEQYSSYQLMQQRMEHMPNAVIDEETSYEAAFFYSDAQISDYSSLLPQYLPMDKPALWIKSGNWKFTGKELIESSWMEKADSLENIFLFLDNIQQGKDTRAILRRQIRNRDLALADGRSGQRVCEAVWELMHKEDQIIQLI